MYLSSKEKSFLNNPIDRHYKHFFLYREKMAFFTRKGLTVPEFPTDGILTEESEEFHLPPTPSSLGTEDNFLANSVTLDANRTPIVLPVATTQLSLSSGSQHNINDYSMPTTSTTSATTVTTDFSNFDYVVDRTYGVEV